jgi:hypothetical protein
MGDQDQSRAAGGPREPDQEVSAVAPDGGGAFIFDSRQFETAKDFDQMIGDRAFVEGGSVDPEKIAEGGEQALFVDADHGNTTGVKNTRKGEATDRQFRGPGKTVWPEKRL